MHRFIELQVAHAANVNIVKPNGQCLLHFFIAAKDVFASLFLIKARLLITFVCMFISLQNGADVYMVDTRKRSALHLAATNV